MSKAILSGGLDPFVRETHVGCRIEKAVAQQPHRGNTNDNPPSKDGACASSSEDVREQVCVCVCVCACGCVCVCACIIDPHEATRAEGGSMRHLPGLPGQQ